MSIFGPRESDPLLQDDPLAPSSEHEPSPRNDGAPAASSPSGPENEAPDTSRRFLQSMADAQNGTLGALNRALANGWTLERVELRPEGRMAIVLRPPLDEANATEGEMRPSPSGKREA